jgi:hypothetical protein
LRSRQCRKASAVIVSPACSCAKAPQGIGRHVDLVGPNDIGAALSFAHLLEQFGRLPQWFVRPEALYDA